MNALYEILNGAFVPQSAEYFSVDAPRPPYDVYFFLLPGFSLQAFSCAVEPLRLANQLTQETLYRWHLIAEQGQVRSSGNIELTVSLKPSDVPERAHVFICSGTNPHAAASEETVSWLRKHARTGGRYGALCTGAFTLARAGLLTGKRFTLHWENQPSFHELFPHLNSSPNLFEIEGDLMTCGGGRAASDMILDMISGTYGAKFSKMVSDMCLNGAPRAGTAPQKTSLAFAVSTRNRPFLTAIEIMLENLEEPVSIDEISEITGIPRRQIERQFKLVFGTTPAKYYRSLRLDRARSLLIETNMQPIEAAVASGFSSVTHFPKCFRQRFGMLPSRIGASATSPISAT